MCFASLRAINIHLGITALPVVFFCLRLRFLKLALATTQIGWTGAYPHALCTSVISAPLEMTDAMSLGTTFCTLTLGRRNGHLVVKDAAQNRNVYISKSSRANVTSNKRYLVSAKAKASRLNMLNGDSANIQSRHRSGQ